VPARLPRCLPLKHPGDSFTSVWDKASSVTSRSPRGIQPLIGGHCIVMPGRRVNHHQPTAWPTRGHAVQTVSVELQQSRSFHDISTVLYRRLRASLFIEPADEKSLWTCFHKSRDSYEIRADIRLRIVQNFALYAIFFSLSHVHVIKCLKTDKYIQLRLLSRTPQKLSKNDRKWGKLTREELLVTLSLRHIGAQISIIFCVAERSLPYAGEINLFNSGKCDGSQDSKI